jgi:5-methylthioadenosine/S-adenosylhomocysteine deaminase
MTLSTGTNQIVLERVDLLIKGGWVVTLDAERRILDGADVAVVGDQVVAVGHDLKCHAKTVIQAQDCAVLPGFVDAHMHETLTRGVCEDLPLDRWLDEICFPLDRTHRHEYIRAAALMSQIEMIQAGITTFLDIYRFPAAAAEITEKSGLRGIIAPQIILDPAGVGETIESAEEFVINWKGRNPRVIPAFGPHAPYSLKPEDFQRVSELAEKHDVLMHTHLCETQWEVDVIRQQHACSPAEYLDRAGALNSRMSVAHGVKLTGADIELLSDRSVSLAYNPCSNMKLASGVAPIPEAMEAGVVVGLGTDSNLSNNNLDMFEEMRVGAMLQKLNRSDATVMPCSMMLEMATLGSAEVFGLENTIGSIEAGKKADLILVNLNQAHLWPLIREGRRMNLIEQLVYAANAGDVSHTIASGKLLMSDRKVLTLDVDETRRVVQAATAEFLLRAGIG